MHTPQLDPNNITASLEQLRASNTQKYKSWILPDEYEVRLKPDLIEYAMRHLVFEYPTLPVVFNMRQDDSRTAFIYDNPKAELLTQMLPDKLDWECIKVEGEESFQVLNRYHKIIIACEDKRWASIVYLICAEYNIECVFWNNSTFSPFRFPLMGVSIPEFHAINETLEQQFHRVINTSEIPQKISVSPEYLTWFWNEFYIYAYPDFTEAFFSFYEKMRFDDMLSPFKNRLFKALATRGEGYGLYYAVRFFHPYWYDLFDSNKRENSKNLAQSCLLLLQADEVKGNLYERHHIQKAYWSLYINEPACALKIYNEVNSNRSDYAAEVSRMLWALGENELALELLSKVDPAELVEEGMIHKGATSAALLGEWTLAKTLFNKLRKDYMQVDGHEEKFFWQSLMYRLLGDSEHEAWCINKGREIDPLFEEKQPLGKLAKPHSAELGPVTLSISDLPVVDVGITVT